MSIRYYLSTFMGSGTLNAPFRARTCLFGKSGILDLRPDETRQHG